MAKHEPKAMDKRWRPAGWEDTCTTIPLPDDYSSNKGWARVMTLEDCRIYEAGADEMLGGLKSGGVTLENYNPTDRTVAETAAFLNQCKDGVLVFIPDKE